MANKFEYCINRNIREIFDSIQSKIEIDSSFKIDKVYKEKECKYDLNVRKENWPEGVWIKIYKHNWFGIFPFVEEADKNLVEKYFYQTPKEANSWDGLYYFSANKDLDERLCINEKGNEIDAENGNEAIEK